MYQGCVYSVACCCSQMLQTVVTHKMTDVVTHKMTDVMLRLGYTVDGFIDHV